MLTLSRLADRISELEQEEFDGDSERLSTWVNMVAFKFGADVHLSPWWEWQFDDVLPDTGNDGWRLEKVSICFDAVMSEAIEIGYTQSQLETPESMDEVLSIVSHLLVNGDWTEFYNQKRQEAQDHENRLLFRRLAHQGALTPDGQAWLKENDKDFLENMRMKNNQPDIDTLLYQLASKAVESETPQERQQRILQRIELMSAPLPEVQTPPVSNGSAVTVQYNGGHRGFQVQTVDGLTRIEPGDVVTLPAHIWQNIQNGGYPLGWWQRV